MMNDVDKDLHNDIVEDDVMIRIKNLTITKDYDETFDTIVWVCSHGIEHVLYNKHDKLVIGGDDCGKIVSKYVKELKLLIDRKNELVLKYNDKIISVLKELGNI